ncbi:hypothetical protein PDPE_1-02233 [Photobacterium damselae subsp. piscicida]|uniref:hypothetical protein n=2 Tax=Photobacterium damselae TaxID=38293 RepID=UPI0002DA28C1|nr:hypothetical protein [Photobacterium damselae]BBC41392.1 hypothetical protein PDPE_1-02233 [Photobacterium damselae subsp. piscicida]
MKIKMIGTGVVLFALAGCAAQMEPARILANGQIRWSDGIKEGMHVSPTGSKLAFANYSNEVGAQPVTIFSRIDSARNGDCEYYFDEAKIKRRLEVCKSGEVTLLNQGRVVRVGSLASPII